MRYLFLILATILGSVTHIALKYLMQSPISLQFLYNPYLYISALSFAFGSFFWLCSLKRFELGVAYLVNSLSLVITFQYSILFFDEVGTWKGYFGVILILTGIFLLNKSKTKKV